LEADYLVVGAGAEGMAFTDALIDHADRQRGHGRPSARCRWTLAGGVPVCPPAPGVRVLQRGLDAARRWVHSADRAGGRLARTGDGAGGVRVVRRVLRERMLESGKVSFYPNCDYLGEGRFVSRLSGKRYEVHSRRRGVDARYLSPQIRPPIGRGCRCWAIGLVVRVSPRHQGVGRSGLAQRGSHPPGYGRLRRTDSCRGSDSACTSGRGWPGWPNSLPRPVFNRSSGCRKPHRLTPFRVTNDVTPDHTAQGSTPLVLHCPAAHRRVRPAGDRRGIVRGSRRPNRAYPIWIWSGRPIGSASLRLRTRLGSFSAGRSGGSRTRRTCRPGRAARALPVHHRAFHAPRGRPLRPALPRTSRQLGLPGG
jgi:hypothetical protein